MVGLFIQLGLTALAFYRGWRWYAVIPMGVMMALGLSIGMAGLANQLMGFVLVCDIFSMFVLGAMCIWIPGSIKAQAT
jgi:hypothetical protein